MQTTVRRRLRTGPSSSGISRFPDEGRGCHPERPQRSWSGLCQGTCFCRAMQL